MDKKTLKAYHKAKNAQDVDTDFSAKCAKLKQQIAEAEAIFNTFPPFEEITNSHEIFKYLEAKTILENLKSNLLHEQSIYIDIKYKKEGIMGIPVLHKPSQPGDE